MKARRALQRGSANPRPMAGHQAKLLVLLAAAPWLCGFSSVSMFEAAADHGGGGGYTFVGSPTSHDLDCTSCHQGSTAGGQLALASDPPGLFERGFVPGTTYAILVRLVAEVRGLDRNGTCQPDAGGCNRNGFVAEFLGGNHQPAGQLCSDTGQLSEQGCDSDSGAETTLFTGGRAVSGVSLQQPQACGGNLTSDCIDIQALIQAGKTQDEINQLLLASVKGRTSWHFLWKAPLTTTAVAFHLGAVDGDGGTQVTPEHNDYFGDATYSVHRTLYPEGMAPADQQAACGASPVGSPSSAHAGALLAAATAWLARIFRRRSRQEANP